MKKFTCGVLVTCMVFVTSITSVVAANISLVEVFDKNTLSVSLSEKENLLEWTLEGEVKVLKDTTIEEGTKSIDDSKKVVITLPEPLSANTTYSLLNLFGAEGSIDFTTEEAFVGNTINNESEISGEQAIESIVVVDESTLEIAYSAEVVGTEFEYKLLKELNIDSIQNESNADSRLTVTILDSFEAEQEYIFIVISLLDQNGAEVELDNSIYDFVSPEYIEGLEEESAEEDVLGGLFGEDLLDEGDDALAWEDNSEEETELNAAGDEDDNFVKTTEETAMNADSTPNTWAETWIIIALALFINGFYYFSRRKK